MSKWAFVLAFVGFVSCSDNNGIKEAPPTNTTPNEPTNKYAEINDFIWGGMNEIYLWQGNVPDLANNRFANQEEYNAYLQASSAPEDFFESLIFDRQNTDIFSWIEEDYVELENLFQGISTSNGVDFGLSLYSSGSSDVFGYVRLILPDSDASDKNIKRGDFFIAVDGNPITTNNYQELLFSDNSTYSLTMAKIDGNTLVPTGEVVELIKSEFTENPIHTINVIEEGGKRIGYLHYTFFNGSFESELNAAFLTLKNEGITDLVLDLRYNPGGAADVSTALASMITGQFKGEVIKKTTWNNKYQTFFEAEDPESLVEVFDDKTSGYFTNEPINSLNLNSIHIIGLDGTASASESLISGLKPYIDVTLIGELTYGKYTGSTSLYDSESLFNSEGANPDHTYAIQPIIYKFSNKLGDSPRGGIEPDIFLSEDIETYGVIGESSEPLLRAAINDILGVSSKLPVSKTFEHQKLTDYRLEHKFATTLIDSRPQIRDAMEKMKSRK